MATDLQPTIADDDVALWRRRQLMSAGFDRRVATRLAADGRFDLHRLVELCERGCAPELAARIMAPLDDPIRP
jgi:hypothetical protein